VTAICIEVQEGVIFDSELPWDKVLLIGGGAMLLVAHFFNLSIAEENPDIGTYLRKHSKMGIYMPIIFNARLITITILLFAYQITPIFPSYFIIVIQIGYLVFTLFGRPHKKPLDLFRSICTESALTYILLARFTEVTFLADFVNYGNMLFPIMAYIEYTFYGLSILFSGFSLIYHFVKKVKSKKVANDG
jgi:hypothetical protein